MRRHRRVVALSGLALALGGPEVARADPLLQTTLASLSSAGVAGNGNSTAAVLSADGRYVAFESAATNLVAGDTNAARDVFVRDTLTGVTTLVSKADDGTIGNSTSGEPSISADGRYVAFESFSTNLDGVGAVNRADIFRHDRQTGDTVLVSVTSASAVGQDGSYQPSISADGTQIAFYSDANNFSAVDDDAVPNVFVRDMNTLLTELMSLSSTGGAADGESVNPAISADGRRVAFQSAADNLVTGSPDTNGVVDVFVRDRTAGTTTYVSKASDGTPGDGNSAPDSTNPSISGNGRFVAFHSRAETLVPTPGPLQLLSDIFVHDLLTSTTTLVSRASDGTPGDGPPFGSFNAAISDDGRYVAFNSTFTNLSDEDADGTEPGGGELADVYVHDRSTGVTAYHSRSTDGVPGDWSSDRPSLSADGRFLAFQSRSETLTADDAPDVIDVFVRKVLPEPPVNTVPPAVSGDATVGATLTCAPGTWDTGTITFQWRRDGIAIPGATSATYVLTAQDAGTTVDCLVTATNADGSTDMATGGVTVPAAPAPGPGSGAGPVTPDGGTTGTPPGATPVAPIAPVTPVGPAPAPVATTPGPSTASNPFVDATATAAELALACTSAPFVLTEVVPASRGRVQVRGAARASFAGRRLTIKSGRTTVGRATVAKDGTFRATVRGPSARGRKTARYRAILGSRTSKNLKLERRMTVTGLSRRGSTVTFSGRVRPPLARPVAAVVVERQTGCRSYERVRTVRPSSSGRFRVTLRVPAGVAAAAYRARTRVRSSARSKKSSATYTLPQPIRVR